MGVYRFEDLRVWQDARELNARIGELTAHEKFASDFAMRDQMRRAALSVMNNIAEDFCATTTASSGIFCASRPRRTVKSVQ